MFKRTERLRALGRPMPAVLALLLAGAMLIPAAARAATNDEAESSSQQAEAKSEAPGKAKAETGLTGRNAVLAREAGLKPEQKTQLAETIAEAGQAMAEWQTENREAIRAANKALSAARQAGDRQAMQQALADAQPLMNGRRAIQQKYRRKIMGILTPEQEARWLGYVLYDQMVQQADALGMTEKQKKQTRTLCDATAKKLAALPQAGEATDEDSRKARDLQRSMVDEFINDILTEDQRKQLGPGASAPPAGAPAGPSGKPTAEESEPTGEPTDAKDKPPTPKG